MTQVIVFTNDNGGVSVCIPTGELPIEAVLAKDCPAGAKIVSSSDLPEADNDFFNAWELVDGKVEVNLDKAKELTKERLRAERAPLLAEQDILWQRAMEAGADEAVIAVIIKEKIRLRDITLLADKAFSTSDLRAIKVA